VRNYLHGVPKLLYIYRTNKHTMIALRFTVNKNERNITSEDQVNKIQFNGLCAYDITSIVSKMIGDDYTEEEAYEICARKQAEFDNWHAHNTNGQYVIFEANFIELERDNQDVNGNRAVVVDLVEYKAFGKLEQTNHGYRCESIELI